MNEYKQGRELKIGDTIVMHPDRRRTITALEEHPDPHNLWSGEGKVAEFAQDPKGMTIEPHCCYWVVQQ